MTSLKLALFILFTLAARSSEADYTCGPCKCDVVATNTGVKVIGNCIDLTTVPVDLPADIQVLHINKAPISRLSDSQFTLYRRLQQILIFNSNIEQIEQGAFRYMINFINIEFYNTKITELPSDCFTFSPNLIEVRFSGNKIKRLQSHLFNNLKYLKEVYLSDNEINTIEQHCFVNVPQLEHITLYNNKLISLDIKFIDDPSSLRGLYLFDNPWHCDTSLCGVMDTSVNRKLGIGWFAPTCKTPQNLTKREWSKSLVVELCPCFWCNCTNIPPEPRQPQPSCNASLIVSNTSSVSEGQDLRLMCKYCSASRVVWTFNDVTLPSRYEENSEQSLTSTLTITNIMRGQQGYYLCKIRSCEDCRNDGVYVSVTGKPQSDIDIKQIVEVSPEPRCDVGPLIISNTSSVSEGQDLRITCKYCLLSRVVWTFNNVILPSNYVENSEQSLTSTLKITNVLRGQQGYYLCKIRSCEDCKDAGVYVSVTGKPQSDVDLKQVVVS